MLNPRTPKSQCFSVRVSKSDVRVWFFSSIGANALQATLTLNFGGEGVVWDRKGLNIASIYSNNKKYITLKNTWSYIIQVTLHCKLHYVTNYITLPYITNYTLHGKRHNKLHITLQMTHYITLHITLHITHYIACHITVHYKLHITLQMTHYITLHITLHYKLKNANYTLHYKLHITLQLTHYITLQITITLPVVPHKAVAEVSKIGNL